jgi:hypothetical protein
MLLANRVAEAETAVTAGCGKTNSLTARDPSVISWRDLSRFCLRLRAGLALAAGSGEEALTIARQLLDVVRADKILLAKDRFALGQAQKLVGDILWRTGDREGARAAWQAGLADWPTGLSESPRQMAERGEMLRGIGKRAEGMRVASQLVAMGYRQSLSNRARV